MDTIIPMQYRQAHLRGFEHFLATGEGPILNSRVEITAFHRDGHEFPVELTVTAIRLEPTWHFTAFVRDLTDKRRVEEALREARDELTRVMRLTAMGQLSASIAHEINQPLTAVAANSDGEIDAPPLLRREPGRSSHHLRRDVAVGLQVACSN